MSQSFKMP